MIRDYLPSMWEVLGILGLGGLGAVAWFFPPFRRLAIQAGFVLAALMFVYSKGKRDGIRRKQKEWLEAERRAEERARRARLDAERDAPRVRDPRDRDTN